MERGGKGVTEAMRPRGRAREAGREEQGRGREEQGRGREEQRGGGKDGTKGSREGDRGATKHFFNRKLTLLQPGRPPLGPRGARGGEGVKGEGNKGGEGTREEKRGTKAAGKGTGCNKAPFQ